MRICIICKSAGVLLLLCTIFLFLPGCGLISFPIELTAATFSPNRYQYILSDPTWTKEGQLYFVVEEIPAKLETSFKGQFDPTAQIYSWPLPPYSVQERPHPKRKIKYKLIKVGLNMGEIIERKRLITWEDRFNGAADMLEHKLNLVFDPDTHSLIFERYSYPQGLLIQTTIDLAELTIKHHELIDYTIRDKENWIRGKVVSQNLISSPDRTKYFKFEPGRLTVFDSSQEAIKEIRVPYSYLDPTQSLQFSPSGSYFVFKVRDYALYLFDLRKDKIYTIYRK